MIISGGGILQHVFCPRWTATRPTVVGSGGDIGSLKIIIIATIHDIGSLKIIIIATIHDIGSLKIIIIAATR